MVARSRRAPARLDEAGVETGSDATWAQLVDHAYSHFVEPELTQPTFVVDWPIELSPFARTTDDDPGLVERFEAVVGGMEFATRSASSTTAPNRKSAYAPGGRTGSG